MSPPTTDTFGLLCAADPDVMNAEQLDELTGHIAKHRAWCDALQVRVTRRQRTLAAEGHATEPRHSLSRHGRQSSKDAQAAEERETVCNAMPGFEDALASGSVSAGHLDAVANATRDLDEATLAEFAASHDDLLADAARQGVDTFGRTCRDLAKSIIGQQRAGDTAAEELEAQRSASTVKSWTDTTTGMCHTHLELDPIRHRQLWSAVEAARTKLRQHDGNRNTPWMQLTVDAFIDAVTSGDGTGVPEILVLIDLDNLIDGTGTTCETDTGVDVPVSTVRRMACDADIVPVVLNGDGCVLDVGRAKRTATTAQRRAIRAMHTTCVHPDCTVTINACRIHHTVEWTRDRGDTNLDLLAPVCEQHHHLVHEGGWTMTITPDRDVTWTRPDGTIYWQGPTTDRTHIA